VYLDRDGGRGVGGGKYFGERMHWGWRVRRRWLRTHVRAALFDGFVRDLSDQYETILGGGGAAGVALRGGKKRLAIARARLRNPSVLVFQSSFRSSSTNLYLHFLFLE
jgi:hypothetical protein